MVWATLWIVAASTPTAAPRPKRVGETRGRTPIVTLRSSSGTPLHATPRTHTNTITNNVFSAEHILYTMVVMGKLIHYSWKQLLGTVFLELDPDYRLKLWISQTMVISFLSCSFSHEPPKCIRPKSSNFKLSQISTLCVEWPLRSGVQTVLILEKTIVKI